MQVSANDPSLAEAMAQLAQMEQADSPETPEAATPKQQPTTDSAPNAARASDPDTAEVTSTTSEPKPGAPAAEDPNQSPKQEPKPDANPADDKTSPYAKNQQRLQGGWTKLNEEKSAFYKERDALKADREELVRKQQEFEAERAKASQPKYKPEDYEQASSAYNQKAEALEAAGKYDEADEQRVFARQALLEAKNLRDNPPAAPKTDEKKQQEFQSLQKEWWSKAAIDYPAVAKQGTPESLALQALVKTEPAILGDPKGMYYAARLVCAETSAARATAVEKEVVELRAKVKALDEQVHPSAGGAATTLQEQTFDNKSEAEQENELYSMAGELDRGHGR